MSFNNKLYDMELEYQSESRTNKTRNNPNFHGYTKTSTVYLIVALAVIVAAILSTGSGILVFLMTSRDLECKIVIPEKLPNTKRPDLMKTTTQNTHTMLRMTLEDEDVERTTRYIPAAKSTTKTTTLAPEDETAKLPIKNRPASTKTTTFTSEDDTVKSSTENMPASTTGNIRTIVTTENNAIETTFPAVLPERTTKTDLTERSTIAATRRFVTDGPTSTQPVKAVACPNGWLTHISSCYYFSNDKKNWTDALTACSSFRGRLVEIYDAEADTVLRGKAKALNDNFWIGLTDRKTEGVWTWNESNTLVTSGMYTNWAPHQPDDGSRSEDCALIERIYSFLWNDDQCYHFHRYICEKELS